MNGVQGVASSNLVIPTRISGSCDGKSRLPFLLNSSRAGFSSRRAVFSRAAGDSQRHLVPCSRGRILPCLSFSALSCSESVAATGKGGEGAENVWGFFTMLETIQPHEGLLHQKVGEPRDAAFGNEA